MEWKIKIRIGIDILMSVLLPFLMAYMLVGKSLHEWLGLCMFLLMIAHHVINRKWYRNLHKGKYNAVRIFQLSVDVLLLISMLLLMASAVGISRYVFSFMEVNMGFGRKTHLLASFWAFILMSVHIGGHWQMAVNRMRGMGKVGTVLSRCFVGMVSVYGMYVWISRKIPEYMIGKVEFAFFDMEEPLILFLLDYLAMMVLFAAFGYYLQVLLKKCSHRQKIEKSEG